MAVPEAAVTPKSTHVSEPALAPFLQRQFDSAEYLNATLPSLSLSSVSSRPLKQGHSVSLAEVSSQTQDLLSQLNAHTTRLSAILTQLTDDILRCGARLAYEVEVLRGETIGLTETLTDGLKGDVEKFLPGGISLGAQEEASQDEPTEDTNNTQGGGEPKPTTAASRPSYITELQTLTLIRERLDSIIKVFGEAMHWSLPPSEISLTSSLISVSGPDPSTDVSTREQKGKEFAASVRSEISDLITGDPENGFEAADVRIQALRELAQVWKGTAEEKARVKFVEGLVRLAEEKQREVEREREKKVPRREAKMESGAKEKTPSVPLQPQRSGGFLDNLQRIRGNF